MKEDILWDIFTETGSVEDYLRYSDCKDDNNDNC